MKPLFFFFLSFPLLALAQSNTPSCVASCEKTSPAGTPFSPFQNPTHYSLFILLPFPLEHLPLTLNIYPVTNTHTASFCDGTETGAALASCECQSLIGSNLVTCIKACPSDQVSWFASQQPALCRDTLFPGVSVSSAATSTAAGNGASVSTNTATAATTSGYVFSLFVDEEVEARLRILKSLMGRILTCT